MQGPVAIFELHLFPRCNGGMQRIHRIQDLFVGTFDAAADQHLAVQFRLPVTGGELPQFINQGLGFARRDELAGIHRIHQQLEFRQLEQGVGHIVTAAAAPQLHDLIGSPRQAVQRVQIAVDTLALGLDPPFLQFFHQLRHTQRMLLIRFPDQDFQKDQQFAFLTFFAWHGAVPPHFYHIQSYYTPC